MGDKKISHKIIEACKKAGIPYTSCNPDYQEFRADAIRLNEIYGELKILNGDLEEICERHDLNGLNKLLHDDIKKIEEVEHDLIKMAKKLGKGK